MYWKIRNLIALINYSKGKFSKEAYTIDRASSIIAVVKRKNSQLFRNLVAKGLKLNRTYQVDTYVLIKKKQYEEYFANNPTVFKDKSEVEVDQWVTVVANEFPVRGKRYYEFFMNWSGGALGTRKIKEIYDDGDLEFYDSSNGFGIELVRCRPASEEEVRSAISKYKVERMERVIGENKRVRERIKDIIDEYVWLEQKS
jgi:hypothetical protein